MIDDRTDLRPVDPTSEHDRFEGIVARVMAAAEVELAARRARRSVVVQVAGWWRPLLAAAAITGIISLVSLASSDGSAASSTAEPGLAEAIGIPSQIAEWVRSDETPTTAELVVVLENDG